MKARQLVKAVGVALGCSAAAASQAMDIKEAITGGKYSVTLRYRAEYVDQDAAAKDALASTVLGRFTWNSSTDYAWQAGLEFDHVLRLGPEDYNNSFNGKTQYPVIADPDGSDLNLAFLGYRGKAFQATAGRQRIVHANQRFVGGVAWRQNEQTYDSIRLTATPLGDSSVKFDYSYVWRVNTIFGNNSPNANRNGDLHLATVNWQPAKDHALSAFAYYLDFNRFDALSTSTFGGEYSGTIGPVNLRATIATQSDAGDNPVDYSAMFYSAELGFNVSKVKLVAGYELLGSDDGVKAFQTPLATLHLFQGWADLFLNTPNAGIEDIYVGAEGKVGKVSLVARLHDFNSDFGSTDYGQEIDLSAGFPILGDKVQALVKFAYYDADAFASDTTKVWVMLTTRF